jgi:hypothetical protein
MAAWNGWCARWRRGRGSWAPPPLPSYSASSRPGTAANWPTPQTATQSSVAEASSKLVVFTMAASPEFKKSGKSDIVTADLSQESVEKFTLMQEPLGQSILTQEPAGADTLPKEEVWQSTKSKEPVRQSTLPQGSVRQFALSQEDMYCNLFCHKSQGGDILRLNSNSMWHPMYFAPSH